MVFRFLTVLAIFCKNYWLKTLFVLSNGTKYDLKYNQHQVAANNHDDDDMEDAVWLCCM